MDIDTIIVIGLLLFVYWRIRNLHHGTAVLKHRYKLYALRDKLRRFSLEGQIDCNSEGFKYLDRSISVTIREMNHINIWISLLHYFKFHRNQEIKRFKNEFEEQVRQNAELEEINREYGRILIQFLLDIHFVVRISFLFISGTVLGSINIFRRCKKWFQSSILSMRFYPGSSDILRHIDY